MDVVLSISKAATTALPRSHKTSKTHCALHRFIQDCWELLAYTRQVEEFDPVKFPALVVLGNPNIQTHVASQPE